jgi:HAE1 family hydrophobic/amphiphilic exporter-1
MAIGFGRGSEANVPLARTVVGGLSSSTLFVLVLVPVLFVMVKGKRRGPSQEMAHV